MNNPLDPQWNISTRYKISILFSCTFRAKKKFTNEAGRQAGLNCEKHKNNKFLTGERAYRLFVWCAKRVTRLLNGSSRSEVWRTCKDSRLNTAHRLRWSLCYFFPTFSFTRIFDYANTILLVASWHFNSRTATTSCCKSQTVKLQTRKREIEEKYCKLSEHDLIIYARYFNAISLPLCSVCLL